MQTDHRAPIYYSYLLTTWEDTDSTTGERTWRYALENPRTGKRMAYATLTALATALESELQAGHNVEIVQTHHANIGMRSTAV